MAELAAQVTVFDRDGRLVGKTVTAKTEKGLEKKLAKLEESGNLYEVRAYATD